MVFPFALRRLGEQQVREMTQAISSTRPTTALARAGELELAAVVDAESGLREQSGFDGAAAIFVGYSFSRAEARIFSSACACRS